MDTMSDKPGLPGLFIAGEIFIKFKTNYISSILILNINLCNYVNIC